MTTPEIILGPPGTGKTTALTSIVQEEVSRGTDPHRIGLVSFTTRAANEAATRVATALEVPGGRAELPHFCTLHSECYRQLGLRRGDVFQGPAKLREFGEFAQVRLSGRFSEDGTLAGYELGDKALFLDGLARSRQVDLREEYDREERQLSWGEVSRVSRAYQIFKAERGWLDFTDMLSRFLEEQITVPLDVLLVDEAQDLTRLQWAVARALATTARRVVVAGDDDQAIYEWSGADVSTLVHMEGAVRTLGQSYRCPPVVWDLAQKIIDRVAERRAKEWAARAGGLGRVAWVDKLWEVDMSQGEVLVLVRNNKLLWSQVEPELRRQGILYRRPNGSSSIPESQLAAIRVWERLRRGESVSPADARLVYEQLGVGQGYARGHKTLPGVPDDALLLMADLREHHGLRAEGPWYDALDLPAEDKGYIRAVLGHGERLSTPRVRVSTIHGAKGAEADHVVLLREMAPQSYREVRVNPDAEARVWYVAVTRAREQLTIVDAEVPTVCPWL